MIIYLDFDGTVVEHDYPKMGRCNFGCMEVLKKLQDAGHEIILNTYRVDCNDGTLQKALDWFENSYMFFKNRSKYEALKPITKHTSKKIHPHPFALYEDKQHYNNELFIDDIALGIPLKDTVMIPNSKMVDWDELDKQFIEYNIYDKTI